MQTDSSASRTCMASLSAVEWTATVWMPISRQARWMRSAISPRLAIRTLSNIACCALFDDHQRLAKLHRLGVLDQDAHHGAGLGRLDRIEGLHRLDDQERLACRHLVADGDEVGLAGLGREVGRTDDGGGHRARMLGEVALGGGR